jgi:hypothetical protein
LIHGGIGDRTKEALITHTFFAKGTSVNLKLDVRAASFPDPNPILNAATLELVEKATDSDGDGLWDAWEKGVFGNLDQKGDGDPDAGAELLPVGKAYFGFTDEELRAIDSHVRNHTVSRFGPVRETDRSLVFEVAFDSVHASKRHKSGLAMRFPRISRIRWDKPAHEADRLETLRSLVRD